MAFLHRVLEPPSYGWARDDGTLYVPTRRELLGELLSRVNVLRDRRNWLALWSWVATLGLFPFALVFTYHALYRWPLATTLPLLAVAFVYGMVGMGCFGTVWFHRYGTHKAFTFSHPIWRFLTRNLCIRSVPEEIYIISHHVHHAMVEEPGDPYNAHGGALYCFLADTNHQPIARDLDPEDYQRAVAMIDHTGLRTNTYEAYQRWGSITHPGSTALHYALNWGFWFAFFGWVGGVPLALAVFSGAFAWSLGIRTYNYSAHGSGKDTRVDGWDFNRRDLSVNQYWSGFVAGEWHNNHHLFPSGARSGFLPIQLDLPWLFIKLLHTLGAVDTYRDYKAQFYEKFYCPDGAAALHPVEEAASSAPPRHPVRDGATPS